METLWKLIIPLDTSAAAIFGFAFSLFSFSNFMGHAVVLLLLFTAVPAVVVSFCR